MGQHTFIIIVIAIIVAGFTANLETIATASLGQNATVGNITNGNSTEILAPTEDSGYSEQGGWG
jgi:hypothetical protein